MIDQFSRINRTFILHYTTVIGLYLMPPYVDLLYPLESKDYTGSLFLYNAKVGDEWHKLAYRFFKNGSLWWVIADLSNIVDPFSELIPGKELFIPSNSALLFDILDFKLEDNYIA